MDSTVLNLVILLLIVELLSAEVIEIIIIVLREDICYNKTFPLIIAWFNVVTPRSVNSFFFLINHNCQQLTALFYFRK